MHIYMYVFTVVNLSSYKFDPLVTLLCLCNILIQYASSPLFHRKIAENGFYVNDNSLLANAIKTISKHRGGVAFGVGGAAATNEGLQKLEMLARAVNQHARAVDIFNQICESAPEEYKDPLTLELLVDPVLLPAEGGKGNVVERSTFRSLRLSGNKNPFTNKDLPNESEIKELPELKAEIEAWVEEQKAIKLSMEPAGEAVDF